MRGLIATVFLSVACEEKRLSALSISLPPSLPPPPCLSLSLSRLLSLALACSRLLSLALALALALSVHACARVCSLLPSRGMISQALCVLDDLKQ
jgi:hypothetical protein